MEKIAHVPALAYAAAFLATLVLARYLTPARWWRHANARALAVLVGGTWALGTGLLWLANAPADALAADLRQSLAASGEESTAPATPLQPSLTTTPAGTPVTGAHYRVYRDLNLRTAPGVSARRIGTVPVQSEVVSTGVSAGDWWEVRARTGTVETTGWASSLWLRRTDERH